ncbi:MAG: YkgJ family cysteine cluster protein, partial [Nitrosopumilaceae archaeon]|nr:YkgJ family cysteine cluster protein [Nitrosopumilaceae archaeon]
MKFNCIEDCSQCCIEREYYPSISFGKIGVLILPDEKEKIENLATNLGIKIKILPRIGVSHSTDQKPTKILAYQLMGVEDNGNTCPFLDTVSDKRSPHGGYVCKIYKDRPLACSAYPLTETKPLLIDEKCKFCKECGQATSNLDSEIVSLEKIKSKMNYTESFVWRYATGIGNSEDQS